VILNLWEKVTTTAYSACAEKLSMKIAIMGAGGMGGWLGARLAAAGSGVALVARGAHLEAIRANGLRVTGAESLHLRDVVAPTGPKKSVLSIA
jgi:ketopantoate reductase